MCISNPLADATTRDFSSVLIRLVAGGILLVFMSQGLAADDPTPPDGGEKQNIEAALALTRAEAGKYEFEIRGIKQTPVFRKEPILRWSNPERGQIYGNVFIWTHHGRPAVVGSLFKWFSPFTHMSHEFHSLSRDEIGATYDKIEVWRTNQAGVKYAAVPEAPNAAATPSERLTQMRHISRQFTARSIDREGLNHELRLLAQPVYRYVVDKDSVDLLDGALFAFVQGTDPEVWLLLEATRASEQSEAKWQYGVARMNSIDISVDYDGQPIWRCDAMPFKDVSAHKSTYASFRFDVP